MEAVHRLNDLLRTTFRGGEIGITPGIQALSGTFRASIMRQAYQCPDNKQDGFQAHRSSPAEQILFLCWSI